MMHQKLEHGRMRQAAAKAALALAVSALPMVSWINEAKGALRPEWRNLESAFSRSVPPSTKPKCEIKDNKILYTKRNGARVTIDQGFGSETPSSVSLIEDKVFAIAGNKLLSYSIVDDKEDMVNLMVRLTMNAMPGTTFTLTPDYYFPQPKDISTITRHAVLGFACRESCVFLTNDAKISFTSPYMDQVRAYPLQADVRGAKTFSDEGLLYMALGSGLVITVSPNADAHSAILPAGIDALNSSFFSCGGGVCFGKEDSNSVEIRISGPRIKDLRLEPWKK